MTTPSWSPHSVTGKTQWFQDQFGEDFNDFVFTRQKELLARVPDSVLIDDSLENVNSFNEAGGTAILFPQVWNGNKRPDDPVAYVVYQLENLAAARKALGESEWDPRCRRCKDAGREDEERCVVCGADLDS